MNLSSRDRRALILGGAGLAVILLYFGVVERLMLRYDGLVSRHAAAAGRIKDAVHDARQLASFQAQISEWKEKAGPLVTTRPYSEQITAIGSRIVSTAGENGVQLQGATPTVPTPWIDNPAFKTPGVTATAPMEQALINIDAQAEWENLFKFIAALYRIEGVLSVEQMDLTGEGKAGPIKVRLSISVLMQAASEGRRL